VADLVTPAVQELVDRLTDDDPVVATQLGLAKGMDRFPSYSRATLTGRVRWAQELADRLLALADEPTLEPAQAADALTGWQVAQRVVRAFGVRSVHQTDPVVYLDSAFGLFLDMIKEVAPIEDRLAALDGRLRALPGLLEEARANLTAESPRLLVEMAIDYAEGIGVLAGEAVRGFAEQAGRPSLLDDASRVARAAVARHVDFLRDELLPVASPHVGAGREVLARIVRDEHLLSESPEDLEVTGRAMIEETLGLMREVAAEMGFADLDVAVASVKRDHPPAHELLEGYRLALAEARDYVIEHDLVTLPAQELTVEETPPFLRRVLPVAAYEGPGPFEARQRGFYWITAPRPELGGEELELALESHPYASMPTVGVHEAFPGHHTQFVRANRAPSLARRIAHVPEGGTLLIEGWAFYCEELMEREGFLSAPAVRLMRLGDQLWRACRVVIDTGLHLGHLTNEEAVELLVATAHLGRYEAQLEVRWYAQAPGYPMSYLLGKREVASLARDDARERTTSLKGFHDALLDWGATTPALIRWGMGLGPRPATLRESSGGGESQS
jgi:uncharacterized protein (DUF885 family)